MARGDGDNQSDFGAPRGAVKGLPAQADDFPAWYAEVVRRAQLAESSSVRGSMVIKPYGYAIWEAVQRALDDRIKRTGHENLYFPLFIPASVLAQEGQLVEGFAPEVAVVTEAGGKKLEEPLAVRPTSEALIWSTYARWIQSYRDLPLLFNQWANVVRWEMRPRLFLRTSEFLWQEGHTAHETEEESIAETLTILNDVYADTIENVLAIPVLRGRKSASERFPGAVETYTLEALMRDGKALQAATSHYLGQGFAQTYNVRYTGRDGAEHHPFATSWGASTRLVGGLVMAHGDDRGLRLPPLVAPKQIVIVPIYRDPDRPQVVEAAARVRDELVAAGLRVRLDDRPDQRPGFKFNEWELKGVPLRLELGARDLASQMVTVARRDTGTKEQIALGEIRQRALDTLDDVQTGLFEQALAERERRTFRNPASYAEMVDYLRDAGGFVVTGWCGRSECEARVKQDASATIRCLPVEPETEPQGSCVCCGESATTSAVWAQAY
jgi:prolyl-tRNA synthetase